MTRKELLIQEAARYIARSRQLKEGEVVSLVDFKKKQKEAEDRNTPTVDAPGEGRNMSTLKAISDGFMFHGGWQMFHNPARKVFELGRELDGKYEPHPHPDNYIKKQFTTVQDVANHFGIKVFAHDPD